MANPTPRNERNYPKKDPSKRGTGNPQRKMSDPNLRVTSDISQDNSPGEKVKSGGFRTTAFRKTRPKGPVKAPAKTEQYRVRPSGPSEAVPFTPHHETVNNVIGHLNEGIRSISDQSHREGLRSTLQTARDANNYSARLHGTDRSAAIAELTRAAGNLKTVHNSLLRDPASREMTNPDAMLYIRNAVNDYKGAK